MSRSGAVECCGPTGWRRLADPLARTRPPQAPGGGYAATWRSCVRHLGERGHDVRVLTTDYEEPGVVAPDEGDVHRELRWYWRDHAFPRLPLREVFDLERWNGECSNGT